MSYHAIIHQSATGWVGWIAEHPEIRFEHHTRPELVAALRASVAQGTIAESEPRECLDLTNGTGHDEHTADAQPYDFWKGLTLDEIDAMQGVKPIGNPRSLLGNLTEEDFEGFDEFIRELRQSSMAGNSVL